MTRRLNPSGEWDFDCAVVGGGPGGLVSALYLTRFKRSTVLINAGKPRAAWIPRTHNLIGYHNGISGKQLLLNLTRQLSKHGVDRVLGEATVRRHGKGFRIDVGTLSLKARKVILATGFEDVQPDIDNVPALRGEGLLRYCPICDAWEHQKMQLAVLARDDLGVQKAMFMRDFTRNLRIVVPEDFRLSSHRIKEIRDRGGIKVFQGKLRGIVSAARVKGLWLDVEGCRPFFVDACYVELGATIRDSAFKGIASLNRTKEGYITTTNEQRTSVPGLFAVGDCVNLLGQIAVAAGQAAVAATTIHNDLRFGG